MRLNLPYFLNLLICTIKQTEKFFHAPGPKTNYFEFLFRSINYMEMLCSYVLKQTEQT